MTIVRPLGFLKVACRTALMADIRRLSGSVLLQQFYMKRPRKRGFLPTSSINSVQVEFRPPHRRPLGTPAVELEKVG